MEKIDLSGSLDVATTEQAPSKFNFQSIKEKMMNGGFVVEWVKGQRSNIQPWSDFLNTKKFLVPKGINSTRQRLMSNVVRFQSNYLFVFIGLFLFCILTSPFLLIALGASLGACYVVKTKNQSRKFSLLGRELSLAQQYAVVGVCSFPLFWLAGAGSAVFWVIGASFFIIGLHAGLYSIEDEDLLPENTPPTISV